MWAQKGYFVYIMSSQRRVLYIGVTNNLVRRAFQHKTGALEGFSSKYKVTQLVYYESFDDVRNAIHREKKSRAGLGARRLSSLKASTPSGRT